MSINSVKSLTGQINGDVILPEDENYDEARSVWNGMIDKYPSLIVRCLGTADVVKCVEYATKNDLVIAVRGGGHNVAGTAVCNDGIVIDLSNMRGVWVDPEKRIAKVQGGALWGDVDFETQIHGLATTGGVVSHTGVAGLTLGGGIGWLMRKHGLTVDNLKSATVVTAEGRVLRVSENENADLFWALRGGGGNFGIVTSFEFELHPVGPEVLAGPVFWKAEDAAEVLRHYRKVIDEAPFELGTLIRFGTIPPLTAIPENLHWEPALTITVIYFGPAEEGKKLIEPLRKFGDPLLDLIGPTPYTAHQSMTDTTVLHGWHYYWKSAELPELSDNLIEVLVTHGFAASSPRSYSVLFHLGGAVSQFDDKDSAYTGRNVPHNININGVWRPKEEDEFAESDTTWAKNFFNALQPFREGVYVNFLDSDDDTNRVQEAYGKDTYLRLVEIKNRYDPENVFHLNQNIKPK